MIELSQTELRRAMRLTADAGALLLASGGEVSRVQQTMEIMARCLHIEDFHVYVLTNGIFSSTSLGNVSEVRHVPAVSIHLDRVEAVNALSRRLAQGELDLDSAEAELAAIPSMPAYGPRRQLLANAVGSACFGYLFGGGPAEMAAAIREGRTARADAQMAYHVLDVAGQIMESSKEGRFVNVASTCRRPEAMKTDGTLFSEGAERAKY